MKFRKNICHIFLVFLFILNLSGCKEQYEKGQDISSDTGYRYETGRNSIAVVMELSAEKISVAESLVLTIQAVIPEDFSASFPEFNQSIGDFTLTGISPVSKALSDKGIMMAQSWTLSPFLPGDYVIPQMTIRFQHNNKQTEEVITLPGRTIPVSSFLDPDEKEPQLSDISPPLSLPIPSYYYMLAVLAIIGFLGLAFYLIKKHYNISSRKEKVPAHTLALSKIDKLLQGTSPEEDFALFYSRLSLILRHYIEERFPVKAAEQTTEEFLFFLGRTPFLSLEQKVLLQNFLLRSDLIKFAQVKPDRTETMESVEACRNFILTTASPESNDGTGGKS